ncbi:alpha-L-arabinofuranosidase C-terminal domain-containing protein [Kamptonema cortianum]|uniref:non-reducing end alpha-L-arabinofuranosidase n=1 Tax=Geitlerinema calcuttense NRMC-F 0142 TaxID=2922238 RepID=A0ABT7M0X6_9CYAN|nr:MULTISPECIES: alpha-L-arabinofuranosidase C-terminal domain-containing protein [Cyanophyceae]MDK3161797.1 alpha-L-arabinofuranosidase C-terminal domain-containing protein [Kamptonema cortianum]MDL5054369.1 alpha-L-arabinofuranosidase C-terminal domain-containing protein [Oscillatoria laete-virens NRMC-F 0139]MDL5057908.1 alpha-L-arabinofuranosidase C-terminal domain-containing protein [Geitlerinema calcuttense NRMC-F 0142]
MKTTIHINPRRKIGDLSPLVFGSFIENLQDCIYGGVYDPASPASDEEGFRADVMAAARAMGVSMVRFPGGCFAPYYHWRDGVGPKESRPLTRYGAANFNGQCMGWPELNTFGTNELISWCRKVGAEPYICVNMGSGSPEEARDWVEYCNHEKGSRWADLRVAHGYSEPHRVTWWALGNEISGPWEFGHAENASDYIRRAREYARAMKQADPNIKLVFCGNHFPLMRENRDWNREVLEKLYEYVDAISMHHYIGLMAKGNCVGQWKDMEPGKLLAHLSEYMMEIDDAYRVMRGEIRFVSHLQPHRKPIGVALDEYGPWYKSFGEAKLSESYTMIDALQMAAYFNAFIRHADIALVSNHAQLVNVLAALLAEEGTARFARQTISYVQEMYLENRGGAAVDTWVDGESFPGKFYPQVAWVDASATIHPNHIVVNLINRDPVRPVECELSLPGMNFKLKSGKILHHQDLTAANTLDRPECVIPHSVEGEKILLPPGSLGVYTLKTHE